MHKYVKEKSHFYLKIQNTTKSEQNCKDTLISFKKPSPEKNLPEIPKMYQFPPSITIFLISGSYFPPLIFMTTKCYKIH